MCFYSEIKKDDELYNALSEYIYISDIENIHYDFVTESERYVIFSDGTKTLFGSIHLGNFVGAHIG